MNPLAVRWVKFNFVGAIGIAVNMGAFALLFGLLHLNKLWATALAVEIAVLHNFVWHEKFTWRTKPAGRLGRLLRFHAGNGVVSIGGEVILLNLFADGFHINPYAAKIAAMAACALANFAVSEWFVFRR